MCTHREEHKETLNVVYSTITYFSVDCNKSVGSPFAQGGRTTSCSLSPLCMVPEKGGMEGGREGDWEGGRVGGKEGGREGRGRKRGSEGVRGGRERRKDGREGGSDRREEGAETSQCTM